MNDRFRSPKPAAIEQAKAQLLAELEQFARRCRERKTTLLALIKAVDKEHKTDLAKFNRAARRLRRRADPDSEVLAEDILEDWSGGDVVDGIDFEGPEEGMPDGEIFDAVNAMEVALDEAATHYLEREEEEET